MSKKTSTMEKDVKLISYVTLRQIIGWLGILLPIIMMTESLLFCGTPLRLSISDYYYSNLGDVFVAILTALAMFLFSYKGYEKEKDNIITTIIGIAALGVAFCPTKGTSVMCLGECSSKINDKIYHNLHVMFAAIFFSLLAVLLIFYFTKSNPDKEKTPRKKTRNSIYIVCGLIMIVCLVWILINSKPEVDISIFWQETIALFAFGFAWLTKGDLILKDKSENGKQLSVQSK